MENPTLTLNGVLVDGWPIEEAPKDGSRMLLFIQGSGSEQATGWLLGWWDQDRGGWEIGIPLLHVFTPINDPTHFIAMSQGW